mmetsp:Transcript_131980/g.300035  ORF Transcript_131980/g.300035 Transcript_131980/m.300035 type:complete len:108 (+) Transcript_131980:76-399(+)
MFSILYHTKKNNDISELRNMPGSSDSNHKCTEGKISASTAYTQQADIPPSQHASIVRKFSYPKKTAQDEGATLAKKQVTLTKGNKTLSGPAAVIAARKQRQKPTGWR